MSTLASSTFACKVVPVSSSPNFTTVVSDIAEVVIGDVLLVTREGGGRFAVRIDFVHDGMVSGYRARIGEPTVLFNARKVLTAGSFRRDVVTRVAR